jgi:hypothetical protein
VSFFISVCYLSRAHLFFFLPFIHQNQIEFKRSPRKTTHASLSRMGPS